MSPASRAKRRENSRCQLKSLASCREGTATTLRFWRTSTGAASDPCLVEMGVFRDKSEAELRQTIGDKLRSHIREHSPIA